MTGVASPTATPTGRTDADPYPSDGDRTIKRPIIPEALLEEGAEPTAEIVTVPEGAVELSDLSLLVDGMEAPADAVGATDEVVSAVEPGDLDVPDNAIRLLEALREAGESPVTVNDAAEHVDVSRRSVRNYLGALADAGALRSEAGDHGADPTEYYLR